MDISSFQIQLKSLAEEMQAIIKGLEKVKQELVASENDGPVSEVFRKVSSYFHHVLDSFQLHSDKLVRIHLYFPGGKTLLFCAFFTGLILSF